MNSNRSGRYVRQLTGYRAFIPKPLPPSDPEFQIDDEMHVLLSQADRALGRLSGSIQTLPNPDLFIFMYVRKEAVLSSQIEGTQSSLTDVLDAEANIMDARRPDDVDEVLNYVKAINYGLERLNDIPVSVRLIREIHKKLLTGVRGQERNPGEIRTSQNWIGPQGCTLNEAIYVPPPPEDVAQCLSDLEKYIHKNSNLPLLVNIGLIHAQFETIHPFLDGNGRVGRLLITFLLCQKEIILHPVLYISYYFLQNRQLYYDLLQANRTSGNWEDWIKFFLRGVNQVCQEAAETAQNIVELREKHRELIINSFGRATANGLILLETIFKKPSIDVNTAANLLGMTHSGANNIIRRFVENNILSEITGQERYRAFRYSDYVSLFY